MGKRPNNPYYSYRGKRGGRRVLELYGLDHYRRMGEKGRAARAAQPKPAPKVSDLTSCCFKLRKDQHRRLGQVSHATKTPMSELIRQAVDMWLDEWMRRHANKISKKRVRPLSVDKEKGEQEGEP